MRWAILGGLAIGFPLKRYFEHHELNVVVENQFTVAFLRMLVCAKMAAINVLKAYTNINER